MKIRFSCKPYSVDRRTVEQIVHDDNLTEQLFRLRVARNPKEMRRLERLKPPPRMYVLRQQAG